MGYSLLIADHSKDLLSVMKRVHSSDFHALLRCLGFTARHSEASKLLFVLDETDADLVFKEWIRKHPKYDWMEDGSLLVPTVMYMESVCGLFVLACRCVEITTSRFPADRVLPRWRKPKMMRRNSSNC